MVCFCYVGVCLILYIFSLFQVLFRSKPLWRFYFAWIRPLFLFSPSFATAYHVLSDFRFLAFELFSLRASVFFCLFPFSHLRDSVLGRQLYRLRLQNAFYRIPAPKNASCNCSETLACCSLCCDSHQNVLYDDISTMQIKKVYSKPKPVFYLPSMCANFWKHKEAHPAGFLNVYVDVATRCMISFQCESRKDNWSRNSRLEIWFRKKRCTKWIGCTIVIRSIRH